MCRRPSRCTWAETWCQRSHCPISEDEANKHGVAGQPRHRLLDDKLAISSQSFATAPEKHIKPIKSGRMSCRLLSAILLRLADSAAHKHYGDAEQEADAIAHSRTKTRGLAASSSLD